MMAAFGPRPVLIRPLPSLRAGFGAAIQDRTHGTHPLDCHAASAARRDGAAWPARLTAAGKGSSGHQNRAIASPTLARKRLRVSGVDTFIAWCARNTAGLCMPML